MLVLSIVLLLVLCVNGAVFDISHWEREGREEGRKLGRRSNNSSKGSSNCKTTTIYARLKQYQRLRKDTATGFTVEGLKVYDAETKKLVGLMSEIKTDMDKDCMNQGFINYFPLADDGKAVDQIIFLGSCLADRDGIVSGNGAYQCAQGYIEIVKVENGKLYADVVVCSTCT